MRDFFVENRRNPTSQHFCPDLAGSRRLTPEPRSDLVGSRCLITVPDHCARSLCPITVPDHCAWPLCLTTVPDRCLWSLCSFAFGQVSLRLTGFRHRLKRQQQESPPQAVPSACGHFIRELPATKRVASINVVTPHGMTSPEIRVFSKKSDDVQSRQHRRGSARISWRLGEEQPRCVISNARTGHQHPDRTQPDRTQPDRTQPDRTHPEGKSERPLT